MAQLTFTNAAGHFDGECVRFIARVDGREVLCGVTIFALKHRCSHLPLEGLLPAEAFLQAYQDKREEIHELANAKYQAGNFEPDSTLDIVVHDRDFHDWGS